MTRLDNILDEALPPFANNIRKSFQGIKRERTEDQKAEVTEGKKPKRSWRDRLRNNFVTELWYSGLYAGIYYSVACHSILNIGLLGEGDRLSAAFDLGTFGYGYLGAFAIRGLIPGDWPIVPFNWLPGDDKYAQGLEPMADTRWVQALSLYVGTLGIANYFEGMKEWSSMAGALARDGVYSGIQDVCILMHNYFQMTGGALGDLIGSVEFLEPLVNSGPIENHGLPYLVAAGTWFGIKG